MIETIAGNARYLSIAIQESLDDIAENLNSNK